MAIFAVNQPITTTVPTITVENNLAPGQHHFQLVVVNNAGVQSDPMMVTVVVRQGVLPQEVRSMGKTLGRTAQKPAAPPQVEGQTAKAPQKAAPSKEKPPKEKSSKKPAKKRTRKKTP